MAGTTDATRVDYLVAYLAALMVEPKAARWVDEMAVYLAALKAPCSAEWWAGATVAKWAVWRAAL
jgi:hypothetical protein